jgi:hypothetical protein
MHIHRLGHDVSVLSDQLPAPGIGFVPVNAFVLHAAEPVVVDTVCQAGASWTPSARSSTRPTCAGSG